EGFPRVHPAGQRRRPRGGGRHRSSLRGGGHVVRRGPVDPAPRGDRRAARLQPARLRGQREPVRPRGVPQRPAVVPHHRGGRLLPRRGAGQPADGALPDGTGTGRARARVPAVPVRGARGRPSVCVLHQRAGADL
ncbi:MAG: Large-conductance mechanosensitive channel, partial [uncultured Nocardioidaceae bacterium]